MWLHQEHGKGNKVHIVKVLFHAVGRGGGMVLIFAWSVYCFDTYEIFKVTQQTVTHSIKRRDSDSLSLFPPWINQQRWVNSCLHCYTSHPPTEGVHYLPEWVKVSPLLLNSLSHKSQWMLVNVIEDSRLWRKHTHTSSACDLRADGNQDIVGSCSIRILRLY